jgi:stage II sporulation protein AA (anti-sigma F factor antagonist)
MSFQVRKKQVGLLAILHLEGEIGRSALDKFEKELLNAADDGKANLLLDLSLLRTIDASAMRVLLSCEQRQSACGRVLALAHLQNDVQRAFEISGTLKLLRIFPSLEIAVTKLPEIQHAVRVAYLFIKSLRTNDSLRKNRGVLSTSPLYSIDNRLTALAAEMLGGPPRRQR